MVFEQKYLEEIIENKFEILKEIKNIETEGVIPTTLSVAICAEEGSNTEKMKMTMEAMDLVLGRGGDQVAVRKNGKYEFFGGKKKETEKRGGKKKGRQGEIEPDRDRQTERERETDRDRQRQRQIDRQRETERGETRV